MGHGGVEVISYFWLLNLCSNDSLPFSSLVLSISDKMLKTEEERKRNFTPTLKRQKGPRKQFYCPFFNFLKLDALPAPPESSHSLFLCQEHFPLSYLFISSLYLFRFLPPQKALLGSGPKTNFDVYLIGLQSPLLPETGSGSHWELQGGWRLRLPYCSVWITAGHTKVRAHSQ